MNAPYHTLSAAHNAIAMLSAIRQAAPCDSEQTITQQGLQRFFLILLHQEKT